MSRFPETLLAHLGRDATSVCHCWRLTRRDGTVSGFTDHDRPLTLDGTLCEPEAGFSASEARTTLGLAVDAVDIAGALSSSRITEDDLAAGLYDGASVETFLVNWTRPEDFALLRKATIGTITRRDGRFVAELEGLTQALDQPGGRYVRRTCDAELGDGRCRFDVETPGFAGAGAVLGSDAPATVTVSGLDDFVAGWFAGGVLTWSGGANVGRTTRIAAHAVAAAGVRLTLTPGGLAPPQPGDTFTVTAGCDKRFATCRSKFDNQLNFRGFPHLPGNDAAYGYAVDGGLFDGGALAP